MKIVCKIKPKLKFYIKNYQPSADCHQTDLNVFACLACEFNTLFIIFKKLTDLLKNNYDVTVHAAKMTRNPELINIFTQAYGVYK